MKLNHITFLLLVITILCMFIAGCGSDSTVAITTPTPSVYPAPIVPTPAVTVPMVAITGGTFNMGSNSYFIAEQPVHSVTVSSFNMGTYEVRNSDYVLFLNSQGNQTEGGFTWIDLKESVYQGITGGPDPGTFSVRSGDENQPVVYVSWYGAVAYCNWLSSRQGLTPCYGDINNRGNDPSVWRTKNGYRLPTEAEWEYACRAGSTADYYWGDSYPPGSTNTGKYAWYSGNSAGNHHDSGQLSPNAFGLYDISGNVWEYCNDWYSDSTSNPPAYYGISPANDPTGPASGTQNVLRGGSWFDVADYCRSTFRYSGFPYTREKHIGFRVVRN